MQISFKFQSYAAPTGYLIPVPTSKAFAASSDSGNISNLHTHRCGWNSRSVHDRIL